MADEASRAKRLDHLAIAVGSLEEATPLFSRILGIEPEWTRSVPEHDVRIAMFDVGGTKVELLEGISTDSSVGRFVEKRGNALHHICFEVDSLDEAMKRLEATGFEFTGSVGDAGVEGRPVAFLHPRSTDGVLTEFIERPGEESEDNDEG